MHRAKAPDGMVWVYIDADLSSGYDGYMSKYETTNGQYCQYLNSALADGLSAEEFVSDMKRRGINIQGIGHRVKSLRNPDKRVELLKDYTRSHFPATRHLDYALEVEKVTTRKKDTLILNVDGCIGVLFLDLMEAVGFADNEIEDIVSAGGLNGLFLLGRTIGMIGHFFDQNRLKEPLYRHPWDDVLYDVPVDVD